MVTILEKARASLPEPSKAPNKAPAAATTAKPAATKAQADSSATSGGSGGASGASASSSGGNANKKTKSTAKQAESKVRKIFFTIRCYFIILCWIRIIHFELEFETGFGYTTISCNELENIPCILIIFLLFPKSSKKSSADVESDGPPFLRYNGKDGRFKDEKDLKVRTWKCTFKAKSSCCQLSSRLCFPFLG